jgi:intracellular sulfur oxidation DsrE/DsrF family protein
MSGVLYTLAGSPIYWSLKNQKSVATSTMEAELQALTKAIKHTIFLCNFYHHLRLHHSKHIPIYCNNQSTLTITNSKPGKHHQHLKHYGVKLALTHNNLTQDIVSLHYLPRSCPPISSPRLSARGTHH